MPLFKIVSQKRYIDKRKMAEWLSVIGFQLSVKEVCCCLDSKRNCLKTLLTVLTAKHDG